MVITDKRPQFYNALDKAIEEALEEIARECEHHVREDYVPVDTGRLKNSISHRVKGNAAKIGSNVEYAAWVELGTCKMKAQPYLKPAAQNHMNDYGNILAKHLKSITF